MVKSRSCAWSLRSFGLQAGRDYPERCKVFGWREFCPKSTESFVEMPRIRSARTTLGGLRRGCFHVRCLFRKLCWELIRWMQASVRCKRTSIRVGMSSVWFGRLGLECCSAPAALCWRNRPKVKWRTLSPFETTRRREQQLRPKLAAGATG